MSPGTFFIGKRDGICMCQIPESYIHFVKGIFQTTRHIELGNGRTLLL
jgi:hypothetical protein